MKTIELKTNIMCGACVAKVTPVLNEAFGEGNWKVNTQDTQKTLTVTTDRLGADELIQSVVKAGYKAEKLP